MPMQVSQMANRYLLEILHLKWWDQVQMLQLRIIVLKMELLM